MFLAKFNATLETATNLAKGAQTDVTLGYPTEALNSLMTVISNAQTFAETINEKTTQEEIDEQVNKLNNAITAFSGKRIYTLAGTSTDLCYLIYSYGTNPNARTENADASTGRRYLYSMKSADGQRDSLVYRIGLSENNINGGQADPLASDRAALWTIEETENGFVQVRNQKSGAYMQIERLLSATPVAIRPYYAKQDNGKMAFYMDADEQHKRLFNVGAPDADGKGGPLEFFAAHADRTRLRFVIEETDIEAGIPSSISSIKTQDSPQQRFFSLQGTQLNARPVSGIYLEQTIDNEGRVSVKKIITK